MQHGSTEDIQSELAPIASNNIQAGDEGEQQRPTADAGNVIRALTGPEVSVALGIGLLLAVLANRIATPDLVDSQARTDILGVIASGGLITNGVYLLVRVGMHDLSYSTATAATAASAIETHDFCFTNLCVLGVRSAVHNTRSLQNILVSVTCEVEYNHEDLFA